MGRPSGAGRAAIVALVALVAAGAALATSGRGEPGATIRAVGAAGPGPGAAGSTTAVEYRMHDDPRTNGFHGVPPAPAPPGKEPLAFNDDGVTALAGYVDAEGPNDWDDGVPAPVLAIGSGRYPARGDEVTDIDGVLVGYAVDGVGFVDLATADDPQVMDALLADAAARRSNREMSEAEARLLFELDDGG